MSGSKFGKQIDLHNSGKRTPLLWYGSGALSTVLCRVGTSALDATTSFFGLALTEQVAKTVKTASVP
jgi:hypothetical protein